MASMTCRVASSVLCYLLKLPPKWLQNSSCEPIIDSVGHIEFNVRCTCFLQFTSHHKIYFSKVYRIGVEVHKLYEAK